MFGGNVTGQCGCDSEPGCGIYQHGSELILTHLHRWLQIPCTRENIGCFLHSRRQGDKVRWVLSDQLTVFLTDFFAIVLVLKWIIDFNPISTVIFSDSLYGLKVLESMQSGCTYDPVLEVLHLLNTANWRGTVFNLCWIPAHMGIGRNEACDQAVKQAFMSDFETSIPLGLSELSNPIRNNINKKRQFLWETTTKGR